MFMYNSKANCRKRKIKVYVQSICTEIDISHSSECRGLKPEQSSPRQPGRAEGRAALCLTGSRVGKGVKQGKEGERSKKLLDPAVLACVYRPNHAFLCELLFGFVFFFKQRFPQSH